MVISEINESTNKEEYFSKNLDQWGKSPDTNILFITGYSGSGKSTLAEKLTNDNDEIICLDYYSVYEFLVDDDVQADVFSKYLNKKLPNYIDIMKKYDDIEKDISYWSMVDKFLGVVESFGREQFKKGNKVIVEGIQIFDAWLTNDLNHYKNKPIIIMNTGYIKSSIRSLKRTFKHDNIRNIKDFITAISVRFECLSNAARKLNQFKDFIL